MLIISSCNYQIISENDFSAIFRITTQVITLYQLLLHHSLSLFSIISLLLCTSCISSFSNSIFILREKGGKHPYMKFKNRFQQDNSLSGIEKVKGSGVFIRMLSPLMVALLAQATSSHQAEPVWLKWQLIKSAQHLLPAGLLLQQHDGCTPLFHFKSSHFSTQRLNNQHDGVYLSTSINAAVSRSIAFQS